jgi:hypothetical protein
MKFSEGRLKQALRKLFRINCVNADSSESALSYCLEENPMRSGACHITSDQIFVSEEETLVVEAFLKADKPSSKFREKLLDDPYRWMLIADPVLSGDHKLFLCRIFEDSDEACDHIDPIFNKATMLSRPIGEYGFLVIVSLSALKPIYE